MDVEVLTGPPGCGKSYEMRREAIRKKGLYLFAYLQIADGWRKLLEQEEARRSAGP